MTPEQFTYWLQGYAEINGAPPSEQQWAVILDHLKLVFDKRTPQHPWANPQQPNAVPYGAPQPNWPFGTPNAAQAAKIVPGATVIC